MAFAHLHTHSEYSLLDGANRIPDLVRRVRDLGMDSLALTDHGNLFGAWIFYHEAREAGIRPIIGMEAYVAFGPRQARERPAEAPAHYAHLVLLARGREGYQNLVKLTSIGYLEGYYRRPRIDRECLAAHGTGLVCLSACLSGEVALWLRAGAYERAREAAAWHARAFGDGNYWLEVQNHGIGDERVVQEGVFRLAEELGLGVVATNDAHYLHRDDAAAHDVLLAIRSGKDLDDPKRFRFEGAESYVKSEQEMRRAFPAREELFANTQAIAERCEFDFEKRFFLPEFPRPAAYASDNELLVSLAEAGATLRYGDPLPQVARERLDYELGVITKVGYAGYFLIVEDFIRYARSRGIPVGPGRGSAAGSLVSYALGITSVDPLRFDLLFERFLNPERISPPDIDVDFCEERRGEVIEYVRERFGRSSVGQIVTFGTMKARAAVKDVARVLGLPPGEADRISKLIPSGPAYSLTLRDAAEKVPELRELVAHNPTYQRLIAYGSAIEGLSRHLSVHAAGVVIAPGPLTDYVPVCGLPSKGAGAPGNGDDAIVTQYDMVSLEKVGMLKMDFLGLTTLTVLHRAVETIRQRHGVTVDLDALDLEDPEVYAMLRGGRTAGVFQFESNLATDALRQMRCDRFDDLVATNALVRPGPLDSGMHLVYIRRKRGEEPVRYPLPELREILEPTYGVIVYQEQVMRIANQLAGYSLAEADVLRKAVGKKIPELIRAELERFVARCVERGHKRKTIEDIAAQIETFGRYGFNKSHSVAYSVVSYQTAWLKAHHPAEFMAALLSSQIGDTKRVVAYIAECRELGIAVLPPDVNESGWHFTVVGDRRIRFGLGAVKNVGRGAIESVIAARQSGPVTSLFDLAARVDHRLCHTRVLEALVASGACDGLGGHRAQLFAAIDGALAEAGLTQADLAAGQGTLFGDASGPAPASGGGAPPPRALPLVPEWTEGERLAREKELVGFFVSGHPLNRYADEAPLFGTHTTADVGRWTEGTVSVAAVVTAVKRQIARRSGAEWARLVVEDFHGSAECIIFPEAWSRLAQVIATDGAFLLTGGYTPRDRGEEDATLIVEDAVPLGELRSTGRVGLAIRWGPRNTVPEDAAPAIAALCASHPGPAPLYVEWGAEDGGGGPAWFRSRSLRVALDDALVGALRAMLGADAVALVKAR